MATDSRLEKSQPEAVRADASLRPFHGIQSPGICFASGHCLVLNKYSSTPTSIKAFDEVWMVAPDGERRLYTDPPEAGSYIETYHDFNRIVGAAITWEQANEDRVALHLEGEDGTSLDLRADLGVSPRIRVLNTITSLTPQPILRSSIGQTVSTLALSQLIESNGMKIAGVTETQEPYRVEADSIRAVTSATATLNDEDLGEVGPPNRSIGFGDHKIPNEPLVTFGAIYLRPPTE